MKVDLSETIQGISLKEIRRLFRRREHVNIQFIAEELAIPKATAARLLKDLIAKNYLAENEHDKNWFTTTSLGKSLAASAPVRIKNRKVHELYKSFLERVEYVNSEECDFAYAISRVVLLGSFLNPTLPDYGDIDFLVQLVPRYRHGSKEQKEAEEYRRRNGNFPQTIFHRIVWPRVEVEKFLKNKSRYISIEEDTGSLDMIQPPGAYRIVYECKKFPLNS